MIVPLLLSRKVKASFPSTPADPEKLKEIIQKDVGAIVLSLDLVGKNEYCKTVNMTLKDDREIIVRLLNGSYPSWVMESEIATLNYLRAKTTIPVPGILHTNLTDTHPLGLYMILEKISGVKLSTIFYDLTPTLQDNIAEQVAAWTIELFQHRFNKIGSLYQNGSEFIVGPICQPVFYVAGRDKLDLDRGPFLTARSYFLACAQRELDCARTQIIQDASDDYQRDVEAARLTVERSMSLLLTAIADCKGLDDEDVVTKAYSLSLAELDLTKIYVSLENPAHIVSFPFWYNTTTKPLWHCASYPVWLRDSLSAPNDMDVERLQRTFCDAIQKSRGINNLFLRTLADYESETRKAIEEICDYDAFRDGFLLLPTLESIIATLPGKEDMSGLQALLNPNTFEGRAARIALLTKGNDPLYLAAQGISSMHRNPTLTAKS